MVPGSVDSRFPEHVGGPPIAIETSCGIADHMPLDDPEYRQICDALIQKGLGGR